MSVDTTILPNRFPISFMTDEFYLGTWINKEMMGNGRYSIWKQWSVTLFPSLLNCCTLSLLADICMDITEDYVIAFPYFLDGPPTINNAPKWFLSRPWKGNLFEKRACEKKAARKTKTKNKKEWLVKHAILQWKPWIHENIDRIYWRD